MDRGVKSSCSRSLCAQVLPALLASRAASLASVKAELILLTSEETGHALFAQLRASGVTGSLDSTQHQLEEGRAARAANTDPEATAALVESDCSSEVMVRIREAAAAAYAATSRRSPEGRRAGGKKAAEGKAEGDEARRAAAGEKRAGEEALVKAARRALRRKPLRRFEVYDAFMGHVIRQQARAHYEGGGSAVAPDELHAAAAAYSRRLAVKMTVDGLPKVSCCAVHTSTPSAHTFCSRLLFTPSVHTVCSHRLFAPSVHTCPR